MKSGIHPNFNTDANVVCACGSTFATGSTVKKIHVEICSSCHPFFTGTEKLIDTEGRVDRFTKRQAIGAKAKSEKIEKKAKEIKQRTPKTLKEMLSVETPNN